MTDVEIFGFAPSAYVRTARMAAGEKGVAYTLSRKAGFGRRAHVNGWRIVSTVAG